MFKVLVFTILWDISVGTDVILVENVEPCYRRVFAGRRAVRSHVRSVINCERLEDCQQECTQQKNYHCESFNYKLDPSFRGKGLCELLTKPVEHLDIKSDFIEDSEYDFYELDRNSFQPECTATWRQNTQSPHSGFLTGTQDTNKHNHISQFIIANGHLSHDIVHSEHSSRDIVHNQHLSHDIVGGRHADLIDSGYRNHRFEHNIVSDEHLSHDTDYNRHYSHDYGSGYYPHRTSDYFSQNIVGNGYLSRRNEQDRHNLIRSGDLSHNIVPNGHRGYGYYGRDNDRDVDYNYDYDSRYDGRDDHSYGSHKYGPSFRGKVEKWTNLLSHSNNNGLSYGESNFYGDSGTGTRYQGSGVRYHDGISKPNNGNSFNNYPDTTGYYKNHQYSQQDQHHNQQNIDHHSEHQLIKYHTDENAIRKALIAISISDCELACSTELTFKCLSFSYRYSEGDESPNCFLSDTRYNKLNNKSDTYRPVHESCQHEQHTNVQLQSECFWHIRSGHRLSDDVINVALSVIGLGSCEAECIRSNNIICRTFTYKFSSNPSDEINCLLSSESAIAITSRDHINPSSGWEVYARGDAINNNGCIPQEIGADEYMKDCYLQYDESATLLPNSISAAIEVGDLESCAKSCDDAPFTCLSFSYNYQPNGKPNCLLSEIRLFDLQQNMDYATSADSLLFAFDLFNKGCWRKINQNYPHHGLSDQPLPKPHQHINFNHHHEHHKGHHEEHHVYDTKEHEDTNLILMDQSTFTVSGYPCKKGTYCEQNVVSGHWSCEIEGSLDARSWDYCCKPSHTCGYSDGFPQPWCYVGPNKEQWRPCSEKYYPYHQHTISHPLIQDNTLSMVTQIPLNTTSQLRNTAYVDAQLRTDTSRADDTHIDHGTDRSANRQEFNSRTDFEEHSYERNVKQWRSNDQIKLNNCNQNTPEYGFSRYWPVSYLHKRPPPNMTYYEYKPTMKQDNQTSDNNNITNVTLTTLKINTTLDENTTINVNPDVNNDTKVVLELKLDNDTINTNNSKINDKLAVFDNDTIEVLELGDIKDSGDDVKSLKSIESEERQIEEIGLLLGMRRDGRNLNKNLKSEDALIKKDEIINTPLKLERRGVVEKINKDDVILNNDGIKKTVLNGLVFYDATIDTTAKPDYGMKTTERNKKLRMNYNPTELRKRILQHRNITRS